MAPSGHVPQRRCLGCGQRAPKADLVRFVAVDGDDGRLLVRDDGSRLGGRGLYICPSRACFATAVTRRAFARAARLRGEALVIDGDLAEGLD